MRAVSLPFPPVLHSPKEDVAFFAERVLPQQCVMVAEEGDIVAGFAAYEGTWLLRLYVRPQAQNRGVGSTLLSCARVERAELQLWCFQANEGARRFHARRGVREVRLADGENNEERMPDVLLLWQRGWATSDSSER